MGLYAEHVLPRVMDRSMGGAALGALRARVCEGLAGEVVELGFGSGRNLPFLPAQVTHLYAVEPSGVAVRLARPRLGTSAARVEVVGLDGQRLPLRDASVDAALCTFTLCTLPDPVAAVREVRRVLRPGGRLHLLEHGRAPDEGVRRWQERLNAVQRRVAGGCTLDRDVPAVLRAGGLVPVRLETSYLAGAPRPFAFLHLGTAQAETA